MTRSLQLGLFLLLVLRVGPAARAETISVGSRHFQVEAASERLAERAAIRAEAIRKSLYSLGGQPDHFTTPIRVRFEAEELGDDLEDFGYLVSTEPGIGVWQFSILATKNPPAGAQVLAWPDAVVKALQYELANRVRGKQGGGLVTWPAWYLWGATALSDENTRREVHQLWEQRYRRKTYRTLAQIWAATGSEAGVERERIQVLSSWLIQQLQSLPGGPAKLAKLNYEINRGNFNSTTFHRIYSADFPTPRDAEHWWTKQQAFFRLGTEIANLDFEETCSQLREILEESFPEPGVNGLRPEDMEELNDIHRRLLRLTVAGHPLAKPAIETASRAIQHLRVNDTSKARPSWSNALTILDSLELWRNQIRTVLDRHEYAADSLTAGQWLLRKGLAD